ncbi:putative exported domain protein [Burkholderia thailandensis]|nr:putative exported domain protein [Burkholderia thailandensis]
MFNVLVLNMRILVQDTAKQRVRFDLYDYRDVVSRGSVRMVHDGTLYVDVGRKDPLAR